MAKDKKNLQAYNWKRVLPLYLVIGGAFGLLASFSLSLEKLASLADPNRTALCDINPILNCGSVMDSAQASLFGIPHSFIGIGLFSALIAVGVVLLAGAKLAQWFWAVFIGTSFFGFLAVQYLVYQSIFVLQTLCPWCMVVWLITVPIFFGVTAFAMRHKSLTLNNKSVQRSLEFVNNHGALLLGIWFIIVLYLIIIQFWFYWSTLL